MKERDSVRLFIKRSYNALPEFIKDALGVIFRLIPGFRWAPTGEEIKYHEYLKTIERLSSEDLLEIQKCKLQRLIHYAYSHVPYYHRIFDERKLKPEDIQTPEDLQKLPLLTKDILRAHKNEFLSSTVSKSDMKEVRSSGSTGTPICVYMDKHMIGVQRAHWWRWSDYAGIDLYRDRMVFAGGSPRNWNGSPDDFRGAVHVTRTSMFISSSNMSSKVLDMYIEDLQKFRPDYFRGFASGAYSLARRLLDRGMTFPLKTVMISSDTLLPGYRKIIEQAFCCNIFDFYGQNEDVLTATECDQANGFHVNMESCIAESVDYNNSSCYGKEGQLVGTCLENFAMPLIRYATGDLGVLAKPGEKCRCGRNHQKISSLEGRKMDMIVTPEGLRVGTHFDAMLDVTHKAIKECQYVQEALDYLVIKVVPADSWDGLVHRELLEKNIRKQVGQTMKINIELVDRIPRRPNGKFQFLVSKLPKDVQEKALSR